MPAKLTEVGEDVPTAADWQAVVSRLRRYLQSRIDSGSVDDVLGDILLRVVEHQNTLRSANNPSAWVYRVATNAVTDHYRRRSVERRVLASASTDEPLETQAPSPEDGSAGAELAQCLGPLIRSLPDSYAQALNLTDIEGLTQIEAAARLGLSTSGMKSRVQRGRERLRAALLRCCQIQFDNNGGILDYEPHSDNCC